MKKFSIILLIFLLILFTAQIKNSTKKIEDEIFTVKENLIGLKKELGNTKLEFNYLSSAEKLLKYQSMYTPCFIISDISVLYWVEHAAS